jgi:gamma-glutamylcysteine synthetase
LNSKQAKIDHALLAYVEKQKLKALRRQHERKSRRQSPDAKKLTELAKLNMLRSSLGLISRQEILVEEEARANRERGHGSI